MNDTVLAEGCFFYGIFRICNFLTVYGYTALLYGTASFVSGLCKLCFDKKGYDIDFIVREILCRKFTGRHMLGASGREYGTCAFLHPTHA